MTVLPRPEELCGDIVPKMPVYQYSLRQMEQKKGYEYDTLIDLDITSLCARRAILRARMR